MGVLRLALAALLVVSCSGKAARQRAAGALRLRVGDVGGAGLLPGGAGGGPPAPGGAVQPRTRLVARWRGGRGRGALRASGEGGSPRPLRRLRPRAGRRPPPAAGGRL